MSEIRSLTGVIFQFCKSSGSKDSGGLGDGGSGGDIDNVAATGGNDAEGGKRVLLCVFVCGTRALSMLAVVSRRVF